MSFDMGPYAGVIWTAYAVSALALGGITLWSVAVYRRAKAAVTRLEKKS